MKSFNLRFCFLIIVLLFIRVTGYAQTSAESSSGSESRLPVKPSVRMDFRNQKISDILYALSSLCGVPLTADDTVTGTAAFHFEDRDFESALERFARSNKLFVEKKDGCFYVSRVKCSEEAGLLTLETEKVEAEAFLEHLSKITATTILYDSLPKTEITLRVKNAKLEEVLNLVLVKLNGYVLERVGQGYFLSRNTASSAKRNVDVFSLSENDGLFSAEIQKALFENLLGAFFKKAGREYVLLSKSGTSVENLFFKDKSFEKALRLILSQGSLDYTEIDDVFYVFEISKKDVLKKLRPVKLIKLKNIDGKTLQAFLPSEFNNSSLVKIDTASSCVLVTGSEEERAPVENFISMLEENPPPKNYNHAVRLKFIKSEELVKNLPPSVSKDNISESQDKALVFFTGSESQYADFLEDLKVIDRPKEQIEYKILVIQRQKTDGLNFGSNFTIDDDWAEDAYSTHSLTLSNIFNINFDIVGKFGHQFAGTLNAEISAGKSHVLADTTLNGISGETITFSNTNTYRYRDIIVDTGGDLYTSTTREISSGLVLSVNGWVSGDDMITVSVDAQVSKQGSSDSSSDTNNPPSTSEKKVKTNVRTRSGENVIIGGLYQTEKDVTEKRTPFLSRIPFIGFLFKSKSVSEAETEFVIYLVPSSHKESDGDFDEEKNIRRLFEKYVKGGSL